MDDAGSWDSDLRYERDNGREPTRSAARTPRTLDARGSVKQAIQPDCLAYEHDFETLRRDGLMAYAIDYVLDHRTCTKCRGSFSRLVDPTTEEALAILRAEGLL